MKRISELCLECTQMQTNQCHGKNILDVKPGKLPCKNYELDPQLVSDQDIEPDERPPSLKDKVKQVAKPLVPDAELPTNKVKANAFKRLATQRLTKTLDDIRKLGNLSAKANYESTTEQIESMAGRLLGAISDFEKKFRK